jgi:hypothetical protein
MLDVAGCPACSCQGNHRPRMTGGARLGRPHEPPDSVPDAIRAISHRSLLTPRGGALTLLQNDFRIEKLSYDCNVLSGSALNREGPKWKGPGGSRRETADRASAAGPNTAVRLYRLRASPAFDLTDQSGRALLLRSARQAVVPRFAWAPERPIEQTRGLRHGRLELVCPTRCIPLAFDGLGVCAGDRFTFFQYDKVNCMHLTMVG